LTLKGKALDTCYSIGYMTNDQQCINLLEVAANQQALPVPQHIIWILMLKCYYFQIPPTVTDYGQH